MNLKGGSERVIGFACHEVGHVRNRYDKLPPIARSVEEHWTEEECADYWAGYCMKIMNISPKPFIQFLKDNQPATPTHPPGNIREKYILAGYTKAEGEEHAPLNSSSFSIPTYSTQPRTLRGRVFVVYYQPREEDREIRLFRKLTNYLWSGKIEKYFYEISIYASIKYVYGEYSFEKFKESIFKELKNLESDNTDLFEVIGELFLLIPQIDTIIDFSLKEISRRYCDKENKIRKKAIRLIYNALKKERRKIERKVRKNDRVIVREEEHKLDHINSIALGDIWQELGEKLELSYEGLEDIKEVFGLEKLSHLKILDLSGNKGITKIEGLDNLISLRKLDLSYCNIKEIEGLEKLINLRTLNLAGNKITEIKGLNILTNLQGLNLCDNYIIELKGLENLKNLQELKLRRNPIWKWVYNKFGDVGEEQKHNVFNPRKMPPGVKRVYDRIQNLVQYYENKAQLPKSVVTQIEEGHILSAKGKHEEAKNLFIKILKTYDNNEEIKAVANFYLQK